MNSKDTLEYLFISFASHVLHRLLAQGLAAAEAPGEVHTKYSCLLTPFMCRAEQSSCTPHQLEAEIAKNRSNVQQGKWQDIGYEKNNVRRSMDKELDFNEYTRIY